VLKLRPSRKRSRTLDASTDSTPAIVTGNSSISQVLDTTSGGESVKLVEEPQSEVPIVEESRAESFTTGPQSQPTHWKQTVFLLKSPIELNRGEQYFWIYLWNNTDIMQVPKYMENSSAGNENQIQGSLMSSFTTLSSIPAQLMVKPRRRPTEIPPLSNASEFASMIWKYWKKITLMQGIETINHPLHDVPPS
jgi:hypothetical protein